MNIEVLWDGTYGLSSLSEKTRKSNRLQMSLQRQHFLLSYLKTLSVDGSPVLNQLSQPVGGTVFLNENFQIAARDNLQNHRCVQCSKSARAVKSKIFNSKISFFRMIWLGT